jgi:hypothetical protein
MMATLTRPLELGTGWFLRACRRIVEPIFARYRWIDQQVWTIAKVNSPEESKADRGKPPMRCC